MQEAVLNEEPLDNRCKECIDASRVLRGRRRKAISRDFAQAIAPLSRTSNSTTRLSGSKLTSTTFPGNSSTTTKTGKRSIDFFWGLVRTRAGEEVVDRGSERCDEAWREKDDEAKAAFSSL